MNATSNITSIQASTTAAAPGNTGTVVDSIGTARLVVYSAIIIVAFLGNGLLVLTIACTKALRTTTNYFLLNMAIGDLLVAVICAPYQLASWKHLL